ncbi:MAG: hypothetical protein ACYDH9_04200 [Limisphaerales bacterium]
MNEQNPLLTLSLHDLRRAIALKEQIENLQAQVTHLLGGTSGQAATPPSGKKRTMSAAGRARIGAAARARWAKIHAAKEPAGKAPAKRKRQVSATARARLSALAKARWAKIKRAGGNTL